MLDEIKARHREIARLVVEGKTPAQIAYDMKMHIATVSALIKDPLFRAHIDRLNDSVDVAVIDVRAELVKKQEPALAVYDDILKNDGVPFAVQLNAAKDILDRTGFAVVKDHRHLHAVLTADDLNDIKARAKASGYLANDPEDDAIEVFELPQEAEGQM